MRNLAIYTSLHPTLSGTVPPNEDKHSSTRPCRSRTRLNDTWRARAAEESVEDRKGRRGAICHSMTLEQPWPFPNLLDVSTWPASWSISCTSHLVRDVASYQRIRRFSTIFRMTCRPPPYSSQTAGTLPRAGFLSIILLSLSSNFTCTET
ncbi:hypothetical protein HYPSUDRAFT_660233 [Hypholoma sublateritium FD-334 SS-4]|uniref:Uncharacterized protein n=1 Tax=Hypholoma sublateritium (strain FD-334 SS-4) TaxID=945553 RepID=A0A0D2L5U5_HYPSF|nr:hypothetical protein HYPSUDRAFT_660233 [Hypholoma sublateritium FD-334 SS-4]